MIEGIFTIIAGIIPIGVSIFMFMLYKDDKRKEYILYGILFIILAIFTIFEGYEMIKVYERLILCQIN